MNLEKLLDDSERRMHEAAARGDEKERREQEEIVEALEQMVWLKQNRDSHTEAGAVLIGIVCVVGFLTACSCAVVVLLKILIGG